MGKRAWEYGTKAERNYYKQVQSILALSHRAINTGNTLEEIIQSLLALSSTHFFAERATERARDMVETVMVKNARTWREAAQKSQRGAEIAQLLKAEFINNSEFRELIAYNATQIKSVNQNVASHITNFASKEAMAGRRSDAIIAEIKQKAPDLLDWQAKLIARTEVAKTQASITEVRAVKIGIDWYIWHTSEDRRVRHSHAIMDGVLCQYSFPPQPEALDPRYQGKIPGPYNPGGIYNCLTGETPIHSLVPNEKIYRRWYTGQIVEIFTASKQTPLRITPNHPILTSNGWVNAGDLDIGDDIIKIPREQFGILEGNPKNGIASFDELFGLYSVFGDRQRDGSQEDFHGDGIGNEQVDIVSIESKLGDCVKPGLTQGALEQCFHRADAPIKFRSAASNGSFLYYFPVFRLAPDGIVCALSQAFDVLFGGLGHSGKHSLTSISWLYALADQIFLNDGARNLEMLCDGLDAAARFKHFSRLLFLEIQGVVCRALMLYQHVPTATDVSGQIVGGNLQQFSDFSKVASIDIQADRVIDKIVVKNFSGHVYNLQTSSGWYISGDCITKNCRCFAEPVVDVDFLDFPAKAVINGQIKRVSGRQFKALN